MRYTSLATVACFGVSLTCLQALEFGNLEITQLNNTNNNQDSFDPAVSVAVGPGSTSGPTALQVAGYNRGDTDVDLGGGARDVEEGMLITSVSENARNNFAGGDTINGLNFANTGLAFYNGISGGFFIPTHNMGGSAQNLGGRSEYNINFAYGYFPYSDFLGALTRVSTNGGPLTGVFGSPGIDLGAEILDNGAGRFTVDLSTFSPDGLAATPGNGILLTVHGKNEGNFSMSRDNGDGTFGVSVMDNGTFGGDRSYEQDPFGFVYIPTSLAGPNLITAVGRVKSDGSSPVSGGSFTITPRRSNTSLSEVLATGFFESELNDAEGAFTTQLPDPGTNTYLLEIVSGPDAGTFVPVTGVTSDNEITISGTLTAIADDYTGGTIEYRIGLQGFEYLLQVPGKDVSNSTLLVTPEGGYTQANETDIITGTQFESDLTDAEGTFLTTLADVGSTTYLLEILSGPDAGTVTTITGVTSDTELTIADTLTALETDYPVDFRIFTSVLPNTTDNFVSYQWSSVDGGWVIQSRDVPDGFLTEEGVTPDLDMFNFVLMTTDPANPQPTISITAPADGGQVLLGDSVLLTADAADAAPGMVTGVEFYLNGVSVGTDDTAPYEVMAGPFTGLESFEVDAAVTDDGGVRVFAAPVSFSVVPPFGAGGGLYFNGLDQYVTFGDDPDLKLSTFTLETWFKPEGNFGGAVGTGSGGVTAYPLVTKGRGEDDQSNVDMNYFLGIRQSDGVLVADFEDSILGLNVPVFGVTPVTPGVWQHAAATFDGTEWRLYLNGNLEAVLDTGGLVPRADSIQHAALGSALNSSGTPAGYFQGSLDEPRIWNVARTQPEIRQSINFEIPGDTGLVGRWPLSENAGSTITSTEGNATVGTLMNGPVWSDGATFNGNPLPEVTLVEPLDGIRTVLGSTINLAATASDDGSIAQVEFFENGVSVGVDTTAPFEGSALLATPGAKIYAAVATDDDGDISRSNLATVNVTVPAPAIPGYSVAVIDGGSLDRDTPGYTPPGNGTFLYEIEQTTAPPLAFDPTDDNVGDYDVFIDGVRMLMTDGLLLFNNHPTSDNLASLDNNLSVGFNDSAEYWVSIEDNENGNSSNPATPEESGRFSLGFFPFSGGWYGGNFDSSGAVRNGSSNFPPGSSVTVSPVDAGVYEISGLPTIGNLIAVSNENGEDNVTAVGRNGANWVVTSRDNGGGLQHDGGFGFVYIPVETPQVFSGLVQNDGTLVPLNDNMERIGGIANLGTQGYEITIGDGTVINPSNSVMFLVGDIDNGFGGDNIYSYFGIGNTFVVFSQDLPVLNSQFQQGGFRFVIMPTQPVILSGDEVEVFATDNSAGEDGDTGRFTFVRDGDTAAELTVAISVSGSATPGADYTPLPASVTFPAGSTTATLDLTALPDGFLEQSETVIVTVGAGTGYSLGIFGSAVVTIESVAPTVATVTVSFQEGVDGYTGQFGMRVGEDGTQQLGNAVIINDPADPTDDTVVQDYYLDGRPGSSSPDVNGIVRFDNIFGNGPGQIPPGAGIQDAQLIMTTSTVGNAQSPGPYIVDQLLVPVDENTTYDSLETALGPFGGAGFEGIRGAVTGYPVAGFGGIDNGEVVQANVTQLVQNWSTTAADPSWGLPNEGFAIFTGGTTNGWSYNTVGNVQATLRPKLVVTYTEEATLRDYFYTADLNSVINNLSNSAVDASTLRNQFMDLNDGTSGTTESLLRFGITFGDPNDLNTIPDGETVVKAELLMTTNAPRLGGSSNAQTGGEYAIHQMLVPWDTTTTFGLSGPVVPTQIDAAAARVRGMGWESATFGDITSIVQNWRAGAPNYGINLKPETTDGWQPFFSGIANVEPGLASLQPFLRVTTAILEPTEFDDYVAGFGRAGMNLADDSDKDRIPAVVEYALGLDPTRFDALPGLVPDGNDFTLTFDKGAAAANDPRVSYAIEVSDDLVNWTDLAPVEDSTRISATIPGPGPDRPKTFGRLRIDYQQ